ncbi:hypothetical protein [Luteimonas lutimaris]|uniref:Phospholipid/glycerol acyltransferase domain-containing protein n=1 Tax=Luteimonas lutimaris TaxID=698645 RepID=A0ABP7MA99_9GAMM
MPARTLPPSDAKTRFQPGRPLPAWHRIVSALLRTFYFGPVAISGARKRPSALRGGRLVLASHRNGAIDGYQVLRAFPGIQFLASVQLLRNGFLKLMFTGIPVVRGKDRERYGIERAAFDDPVAAACAHLRAGGDIAVFPEGSSEWGHRPQPYRAGAARIARVLVDEGLDLEVVPAGLFYSAPDRFRSLAEVRIGAPVAVPTRDGRDDRAWEQALQRAFGEALDAVSVNCDDAAAFESAQRHACTAMRNGHSFAGAFLERQQALRGGALPASASAQAPAWRRIARGVALAGMLALWPVLLAAWLAGRKADARNTVTFFRMAGGLAMALLWLPLLCAALVAWPCATAALLVLAAAGWWLPGLRWLRP